MLMVVMTVIARFTRVQRQANTDRAATRKRAAMKYQGIDY